MGSRRSVEPRVSLFAPKELFTVKKGIYFYKSDPVEYAVWRKPSLNSGNIKLFKR